MKRLALTAIVWLTLPGAGLAQTTAKQPATTTPAQVPVTTMAVATSVPAPEETLLPLTGAAPVPESAPLSAAVTTAAEAQAPERTGTPIGTGYPSVTFGVLTFLQYQA